MTAIAPVQRSLIFLLYVILRVVGLPLFVLYFLYRGYRDSNYFRHFTERLGALPGSFKRTPPDSIWLHAVSVGEVISGTRLIQELRHANPAIPIYLSTTTVAGRAVAEQKAAGLMDGVFYAPIDAVWAVRRVLQTIRPAIVVVLETEIWPVLWREVKRSECAVLVLNGRISDRAFPRYRRLRWLFSPVLAIPDAILVQSERDQHRYLALGAPPDALQVFGNLKYDAAPATADPPALVVELIEQLRPEGIWIAASTMPGLHDRDIDEDLAVIDAFRELAVKHPRHLLILVPRRPERFAAAADKLRAAGVPFVRRSAGLAPLTLPCVLLLDTMGELASLFPLADVVFIGGTLAIRGGHNPLEPAICARPIVVGSHMENFETIAAEFRAQAAWLEIEGPAQLASAIDTLLSNPEKRKELGRRAQALARQNTGVAARAAAEILRRHDLSVPRWDRPGISAAPLWLLAQLWKLGNRIKQQRDTEYSHALNRPVISAGGIAMGGTGKTPFVEMLAGELRRRGLQPAILTRGYHRRALDKHVLVQAGTRVSTCYTGDEAQIFVRSGDAHLGIGADRWTTGKLLEERFPTGIFLLDDGFQHRKLRRDLDIVLIDALNPFPGGEVFPLGFLREPLSGLARAGAFVITRAQPGRHYEGIRRVLHRVNPKAPIFTASVEPRGWFNETMRVASAPPADPVAAFCGLGNPATFWQTLRHEGFDPVYTWTFGDHQHYRPQELRRLGYQARHCGAAALLTTEKDAMNLPENASALVAPLEIYWLKIAIVVHQLPELLSLIESKRRAP